MAHAVYHGEPERKLEVVKQHEDGTVDLANEDGVLEIARCKVNEKGRTGSCTANVAELPKPEKAKAKAKAENAK